MDKKSFKILELDKIFEMLKENVSSPLGMDLLDKLQPSEKYDEVKNRLDETTEAQSILIKRGHISMVGIHDIVQKAKRTDIGATLDATSLVQIADTMRAARVISSRLSGDGDEENYSYPIIQMLASSIYIHKEIEERIHNSIIGENEISDNASYELKNIRRKIIQKNQSIRSKLNAIIGSKKYQQYLQESLISMRGDRFVIPVKAAYRGSVSGIVHDQSSSGATLFIEPMSIVEVNNDLRQLKLQEQEEIRKILAELSQMVGGVCRELISNQEVLARLDFIFAKAKLSLNMKAIEPKLVKEMKFKLKNGRHPLLDKKAVVPNTIYMGDSFHTLVITGPNTGGKTVTIKMVGLLALMTQCGLHIPVDYGSYMCVFDDIFADIGDEQSIEENLSTFSSHMTRIVDILDKVTENSLVIFDELGAGTDPVEGAALAIAIIEDTKMANAMCIATTHYSEIKKYALAKNDIENAAVEFDMEKLAPTYKLLIGVPGKSNAFEISKKLGLKDYIIDRATEFIDNDDIEIEEVLQNVEKNRIKAEEDKLKAKALKLEAENLKEEYNKQLQTLEKRKEKAMEKAKTEAFAIKRQAKEDIENLIKEIKKIEKQQASMEKNVRLSEIKKEISASMGNLQPSLKSMVVPKYASKEIKTLKQGENVKVVTLNQDGVVVSSNDKKKTAVIQIGIMKMTLPYKALKIKGKEEKHSVTTKTRKIIKAKAGNVKREVDLRGLNLEEAILDVGKYLDDACVAGHETVTIIHGVGTGVLKKGISEWLKTNKLVKEFRPGQYGEGGMGVTIVTLK